MHEGVACVIRSITHRLEGGWPCWNLFRVRFGYSRVRQIDLEIRKRQLKKKKENKRHGKMLSTTLAVLLILLAALARTADAGLDS